MLGLGGSAIRASPVQAPSSPAPRRDPRPRARAYRHLDSLPRSHTFDVDVRVRSQLDDRADAAVVRRGARGRVDLSRRRRHALADRLTAKRERRSARRGPVVTAPPVEVAEADEHRGHAAAAAAAGTAATTSARSTTAASTAPTTRASGGRWTRSTRRSPTRRPARSAAPVRVSWYGDSVIASDAIPGRLRRKLQGELGDGGPGFVFVVPPHRFSEHEAITRSARRCAGRPHAISRDADARRTVRARRRDRGDRRRPRDDQARRRQGRRTSSSTTSRSRTAAPRRSPPTAASCFAPRPRAMRRRPATRPARAPGWRRSSSTRRAGCGCSASLSRTRAARSSTTSASSA